jgi:alpha-L-rhamnosidase
MLAAILHFAASSPLPPAPYDLRVEMLASGGNGPVLGVDAERPELSWSLTSPAARGTVSTGYQLQLQRVSSVAVAPGSPPVWNTSAAVLWDTGKVPHCHGVPKSVLCVPESHVNYAGPPLAAATAYQWRVRWWSNTSTTNPSNYSAPAIFVTGMYQPADWRDAVFLTCAGSTKPTTPSAPSPAPGRPVWPIVGPPLCRHLLTDFALTRTPVRATAFLAAMGYAELWINGKKTGGSAVLEPSWTQYDRRLNYVSYDVTDFMACPKTKHKNGAGSTQLCVRGNQTAGIRLGNGWPGHLGHTPTAKLLIKLEFDKNQEGISATTPAGPSYEYVTSGAAGWHGSWKGPILLDDIYGGETYDARLEINGFGSVADADGQDRWCPDAHPDSASCPQPAGPLPDAVDATPYADPSTRHAILSSAMMEPIRALQLLPARQITTPHPGVQVLAVPLSPPTSVPHTC